MQNFIEFYRKYFLCGKKVSLGSGAWELVLGQLRPKDLHSHKSRTLDPIFLNKASFYVECEAE